MKQEIGRVSEVLGWMREEQADTLAAKIMTVVDGVEPEPGKVSKARLQFDAYRWHAGNLAQKDCHGGDCGAARATVTLLRGPERPSSGGR